MPSPAISTCLALGLAASLCGCNLGYYGHLARGQARILSSCQPLDELLAQDELPDDVGARLRFVQEVRTFAGERLGLNTSKSYTCFYDTGDDPVSWNVSASPPDRLEPYRWHFPIVGALPYKGFFSLSLARRERDLLGAEGYDVILRSVSAYSTLGFFSDPVLSDMLKYPDDALADLLIHELTHATVYVKGHTDFNESLATFVGRRGSLDFLAERNGAESGSVCQALERREDAARFGEFMRGVVATMDSLYQSGGRPEQILSERSAVFEGTKDRYRALRGGLAEASRYDGFLQWEVNNARLLSYRRYHHNLEAFEQLWESRGQDLRATVEALKQCGDADRPWQCAEGLGTATADTP
ncbi:aminopeptidase [Candidatus Latescibacterota bacterium]